ncbi:MAG: right-handed parallel beta-helix repeat-containing protein [Methylocystaceae bacterium]|nr:right-handed parallel beta-helix repeat-containing protein [Methylocystaceae bacterium]
MAEQTSPPPDVTIASPSLSRLEGLRLSGEDDTRTLRAALHAISREPERARRQLVIRGDGDIGLSEALFLPGDIDIIVDGEARFVPLVEGTPFLVARGRPIADPLALRHDAPRGATRLVLVDETAAARLPVGSHLWVQDDSPLQGCPNSKGLPQAQLLRIVGQTEAEIALDEPLQYDFTVAAGARASLTRTFCDLRFENLRWGSFEAPVGGTGLDLAFHTGLLISGFDVENTRTVADPDDRHATLNRNGITLRHSTRAQLHDIRGTSLGWYLLSIAGACHHVRVSEIHGEICRHVASTNWNGPGQPIDLLIENGSARQSTFAGFDSHDVGRDLHYRRLHSHDGLDAGFQMRTSNWLLEECTATGNASNGFMWRAEKLKQASGDAVFDGQTALHNGIVRHCDFHGNGTRGVYSHGPLVLENCRITDNGREYSLTDAGGVHLPSGRVSDCVVAGNCGAAFRVPTTNVTPRNYGQVDILGGEAPHDPDRQRVLVSGPPEGLGACPVLVDRLVALGYPSDAIATRDGDAGAVDEGLALRRTRFSAEAMEGNVTLVAGRGEIRNPNIRSLGTDAPRTALQVDDVGGHPGGRLQVEIADGVAVIRSLCRDGRPDSDDDRRLQWRIL